MTKSGNLSDKALKRIFKGVVVPKKSSKRPKMVKTEPIEASEGENEEIPVLEDIYQ